MKIRNKNSAFFNVQRFRRSKYDAGKKKNFTKFVLAKYPFSDKNVFVGTENKYVILAACVPTYLQSIVQLNKKVLTGWAQNDPSFENATTILKTACKVRYT